MEQDNSQYMSMFVDESREHLQVMNRCLLELDSGKIEDDIINEIFRAAHTLKGMSATMGFHPIAELAHNLENLLDQARNKTVILTPEMVEILFKGSDILAEMVEGAAIGKNLERALEMEEQVKAMVAGTPATASVTSLQSDHSPAKEESAPKKSGSLETVAEVDKVELNQFELTVLEEARQKGFNVFQMKVALDEGCLLKVARVFMIFRELEALGDVLKAVPPVTELEQEQFDLDFMLVLITNSDADTVHKTLVSIAEVSKVQISPYHTVSAQAIQAPQDLQKGAGPGAAEASPAGGFDPKEDLAKKGAASRMPQTVRVDISRLDVLMNLVGELVINRTRLDQISNKHKIEELNDAIEDIGRVTTELQNLVMKVRMVPMEQVFQRFPRMIRDMAKELNKEIKLVMKGQETELDRTVIDEIGDPLVHILRNSTDHGIEGPNERVAAGKPRFGTIELSAYHEGNHVFIRIKDDGKGIDPTVIRAKVVEKGLLDEDAARRVGDEEIISYIFAPGFSTAQQVTDISGRGVGMDVVRTKIEGLSGAVEISSEVGKGTEILIKLPLTLAIIQALLVRVGTETYAVPLAAIEETLNILPEDIRTIQGGEVINLRGSVLKLIRMRQFLAVPETEDNLDVSDEFVVVVKVGDRRVGVVVDETIGQQEIVIKSMGGKLSELDLFAGAMILGDGRVALILDVGSLVDSKKGVGALV